MSHHRLATLILTAIACAWSTSASAIIIGPYAADPNTRFLFHFNEANGTATANAGTLGNTGIAVTLNTVSASTPSTTVTGVVGGAAGYSGFGNAGNFLASASSPATNINTAVGYDFTGNSLYHPDQGSSTPSPDRIPHTSLIGGDGSFTVEAMVYFTSLPTDGATHQIVCTDSNAGGTARGLQFRISNVSGTNSLELLAQGSSVSVAQALPSGDNALAVNTWYHAAASYNGSTDQAILYWTKVDPAVEVANQILSTTADITFLTSSSTGPFVIGNENRGTGTAGFRGYIDEVRFSSTIRSADQFIFSVPEPAGILLMVLGTAVLIAKARRRA